MDERLRGLERTQRAVPGDPAGNARYLRELERLIIGGHREALPVYSRAGGVWIEDLTNQHALLDSEGLPVEHGVPVFRFYGVQSRGERLVVTVRDVLEGGRIPVSRPTGLAVSHSRAF